MYLTSGLKVKVNLPESTKRRDWAEIHPWESSKEKSTADQKKGKKKKEDHKSFSHSCQDHLDPLKCFMG